MSVNWYNGFGKLIWQCIVAPFNINSREKLANVYEDVCDSITCNRSKNNLNVQQDMGK